jgi:hypothetical protein
VSEAGEQPKNRIALFLDGTWNTTNDLGLALGGRPAAGFAKRLMLPVSKDTFLRVVQRRTRPPVDPPRVIGIDDWSRMGPRYAFSTPSRLPAIDMEDFAGHEGSILQIKDSPDDVGDLVHSTHRVHCSLDRVRLGRVHRCLDDAGRARRSA